MDVENQVQLEKEMANKINDSTEIEEEELETTMETLKTTKEALETIKKTLEVDSDNEEVQTFKKICKPLMNSDSEDDGVEPCNTFIQDSNDESTTNTRKFKTRILDSDSECEDDLRNEEKNCLKEGDSTVIKTKQAIVDTDSDTDVDDELKLGETTTQHKLNCDSKTIEASTSLQSADDIPTEVPVSIYSTSTAITLNYNFIVLEKC